MEVGFVLHLVTRCLDLDVNGMLSLAFYLVDLIYEMFTFMRN